MLKKVKKTSLPHAVEILSKTFIKDMKSGTSHDQAIYRSLMSAKKPQPKKKK